eukprot:5268172-Ditylum_brightwellii.AAC.1
MGSRCVGAAAGGGGAEFIKVGVGGSVGVAVGVKRKVSSLARSVCVGLRCVAAFLQFEEQAPTSWKVRQNCWLLSAEGRAIWAVCADWIMLRRLDPGGSC